MSNYLAQIGGIDSPSTRFTDPNTLVGDITSRFLLFAIAGAGMFFLLKLISAGYLYLTSYGNPGQIQTAQATIFDSIVGLIVVLCAFFAVQAFQFILGIKII